MKKIFSLFSLFVTISAFAVHDTTIVDRTCLIEFNWQGKTVEVSKSMCKVLLSGQLVYVYDNSLSDHLLFNGTPTTYVLDYRKVETPACASAELLRQAVVTILNAGNCGGGGGGGSGTVTSIATGQGLTGGPITTSGTVSVANLGITNAMIANSTINLTTKVNGTLPVTNGGTGWNYWVLGDIPVGITGGGFGQLGVGTLGQVLTATDFPGVGIIPRWGDPASGIINTSTALYTVGSVPFQGSGKRLVEDNLNFRYDSINKTLNTTRQLLNGRSGVVPLTIYPNESRALYIESQKGGILISNTNTDVPGMVVRTDGLGVSVDSKEMALKSTSEKQAAVLNQTGDATANVTASVVAITRDVNNANGNGTFDCTGAMLDIVNNIPNVTSSTGPLIRAKDNNIDRFVVQNNGKVYANTQTDIKLSMGGSVGSGLTSVSSVGSTATDIFTYTVKGSTLDNDGDEFVAKYFLEFNEFSKTKSFIITFGGSTTSSPVFSLPTSSGAGSVEYSIIKVGTNLYRISTKIVISHSGSNSPIVAVVGASAFSFPATLTSDQVLKLTATCESGSVNGGVKGAYAKYYLNPQN